MVRYLKIDFDNVRSVEGLRRRLLRLSKVIRILRLSVGDIETKKSPSGKGYHVIIDMKRDIPDIVAVTLQSLMGSDYKRECYNLIRVANGIKNWNVLFKSKKKFRIGGKRVRKNN